MVVEVRAAEVLLMLEKGQKRMAYAVANALNATARAIQQAERARVAATFKLRRPEFILRQAAVIKGATGSGFASVSQGRYEVRIAVGQKKNLLLSQFEEGAERYGQRALHAAGESGVAIPVKGHAARPSEMTPVPQPMWVSRLGLGKGRKKNGTDTFIEPGVGIFQRRGESRVLLYAFSENVRLKPELHFVQIAQGVTAATFASNLQAQVMDAFEHQANKMMASGMMAATMALAN